MADWASRFRRLLERNRRDDGSRWSGAAIERATRGVVSKDYVSKLKTGKIQDPSFEKLHAISRAMGFPLEAWTDDDLEGPRRTRSP